MKKFMFLLGVALMSASLWARPSQVPSVADLQAKYDAEKNIVLAVYFDEAPCYEVRFVGGYNEWSTDTATMAKFDPLADFEGWYAVEVPWDSYANYPEDYPWPVPAADSRGWPIQLKDNGPLDWHCKTGNEWINMNVAGSKTATLEDNGYDEICPRFNEPGVYIYEVTSWQKNACDIKEITCTVTILGSRPEDCNPNSLVTPNLIGPFSGWEKVQTSYTNPQLLTNYSATVRAESGSEFFIVGDGDFNYLQQWTGTQWENVTYHFPAEDGTMFITLPDVFTWSNCDHDVDYIIDGIKYKKSNTDYYTDKEVGTHLWVTGVEDGKTITTLKIPAQIDGWDVTTIKNSAFYENTTLKTVVMPNTIKYVGMNAFRYCSNLENVIFSNTLYYIGGDAFAGCKKLDNILLPASLKDTGRDCFYDVYASVMGSMNTAAEGLNYVYIYPNAPTPRIFLTPQAGVEAWTKELGSMFTVMAISAEQVETDQVSADVDFATNSVTIKWPKNVEAKSYTLTLYIIVGGARYEYMTLNFDADGELLTYVDMFSSELGNVVTNAPRRVAREPKARLSKEGFTYTLRGVDTDAKFVVEEVALSETEEVLEQEEKVFETVECENTYELPEFFDFAMAGRGSIRVVQDPDCEGIAIIEAVPNEGYEFFMWSDGGEEALENPRTLDLENKSYGPMFADFAIKDEYYELTFSVEPLNGATLVLTDARGIECTDGRFAKAAQNRAHVAIELDVDYEFDYWEFDQDGAAEVMEGPDHELDIHFTMRTETITNEDGSIDQIELPAYPEVYVLHVRRIDTGIEEIIQNSELGIKKVMIDGQLYILREGKVYNVLGAEL